MSIEIYLELVSGVARNFLYRKIFWAFEFFLKNSNKFNILVKIRNRLKSCIKPSQQDPVTSKSILSFDLNFTQKALNF